MPDAAFVTAQELAGLFGCSAWAVMQASRRTGPDGLPSYRLGKKTVFDRTQAELWFRENCRCPAGPRVPVRRLRRQRRDAGRPRAGVQP